MFYRVTADLYFTEKDEANDFYQDCQLAILKSSIINPGQLTEEKGVIVLHHCFHDEQPNKPCVVVASDQAAA